MKLYIVTWPGTAQTVPADQLDSVTAQLTSYGLSHTVEEIKSDTEKPAPEPAKKSKKSK